MGFDLVFNYLTLIEKPIKATRSEWRIGYFHYFLNTTNTYRYIGDEKKPNDHAEKK